MTKKSHSVDNSIPGFGWANASSHCLCTNKELPSWHFQHRGIHFGYRKPNTSFQDIFYSLFRFHNESINIWSHYIAIILILAFFAYQTDGFKLLFRGSIMDNIVLCSNVFFANIMPMFSSAFCHHFYCVDKKWHKFCWFFDFSGILVGMLFGGIGFAYFAFYCQKLYALYYIIFLVGLCIFAYRWCWFHYDIRLSKEVLIPVDRFPEFSFSLSSFVTFSSFIPLGVALYLKQEYLSDPHFFPITIYSIVSPVLLSIGVMVFAQGGFPERFSSTFGLPDHFFDFIGHSHQLWHFTTFGVMFCWIIVIVAHYRARVESLC